jgi:hypothetical protein
MTMDETPSREPQQVIDALGDLFDAVAPERPIEAEEELIEAGRDPAAVATAMRRIAEDRLGINAPAARSLRHAANDRSRRESGEARSAVRWRSLALLAAGALAGILASTWLADRPDHWRPWPFPSAGSTARRMLNVPAEPSSDASLPQAAVPQGPSVVLPSGASHPVEPGPAAAQRGKAGKKAVHEVSTSAASIKPLPSPGEGSLGVVAELNAKTWQLAEGRMPPELLRHYRDGEWWHTIHQLSPDVRLQDPLLLEAGTRNLGKFAIAEHGEVVDVTNGRQPESIFGPPFPVVDGNDAQAGAKIVWNYF